MPDYETGSCKVWCELYNRFAVGTKHDPLKTREFRRNIDNRRDRHGFATCFDPRCPLRPRNMGAEVTMLPSQRYGEGTFVVDVCSARKDKEAAE